MTKKDYVLLASAVRESLENYKQGAGSCREGVRNTAIEIAKRLQLDNPRFDWFRFMEACGVEDNRA